MKAKSEIKPNKVEIDHVGEEAVINLFDNIVEFLNEDGVNAYEYDHHVMVIPFRNGLKEIVMSDFNGWVEEAKMKEQFLPEPPSLEELNRSDIDYLSIMTGVDL